MAKLLLILLVGLVFESAGVVCLKKGMNEVGEIKSYSLPEIARVLKAGIINRKIWLGVLFEAIFFASLLILLSRSDISFLWPLTALSFVFATFAATWFLGEHVSAARWAGVIFIMIGAGLISYSEHKRADSPPATIQAGKP
jgi:drug/metabolite transporter (DMT)-like permease